MTPVIFLKRALVAVLLTLEIVNARPATSGSKPWPSTSTVTVAPGVLFVCPYGDGELLSEKGLTISASIRDVLGSPARGIPATDFFLIGCGQDLRICSQPSPFPTGSTDVNGFIALDGRIAASGCDNAGVRLVVQGIIFPDCLPIQARSADVKLAGGCPGDFICADGQVSAADFAYFASHYKTAGNPGATYSACLDIAAPYGGALGAADFARFAVHFRANHSCAGTMF
jgi:hypothetical protein